MMKLSSEAQEVLQRSCAAYAAQPFAADKAERLRPAALCRAEQQLALLELRQAGMLELRRKIWGEQLYQIPAERLASIQQTCFPYVPRAVPDSAVALQSATGAGLTGELFRALLFTAREGLPLTGKGAIHSKKMSRLAAGLSLQEHQLADLISPDAGRAHPHPLPAMVIVDLMLAMGLACRNQTAIVLDSGRLKSWFGLTEAEMSSRLYGVILERYGQQSADLQHFRYFISAAGFAPGQWYSLTEVVQAMAAYGLCVPGPQLEAGCLVWLRGLAAFGWCELGSGEGGDACFRWTRMKPLPEIGPENGCLDRPEAAMFIVQPDFEVLVLPETPFPIRWRLAGCAELLHSDDLWSFRLTQKMLEAAAEQGRSPGEEIAWLASHAHGGLPGQVEQALKHWAKGIGRTELSEVILLACRNEKDGEVIAAHPRLQESLTRVGPLHFIVQPEEVAAVRRELAGSGLAPRFSGGREGKMPESDYLLSEAAAQAAEFILPDTENSCGLFGNKVTLQLIPFVSAEAEELMLPGRTAVPQMWLKEWRQYHGSTAQKVMEQALEWGVKVRLALEDRVHEFIPGRIHSRPWRVTGYLLDSGGADGMEAELAAGDWQEMMLLLPRERRISSSSEAGGYVMIR
ncbi:hypothetical protein C2I18_23985 [Paenibacillus sp. PK3_47]|uniref:helicase-associated domain-containing protein n=1 Tax=Paenibacillus sp. PK3_47 TaxID=2072642 RepID=UPI00201E4D95|nr:helicase-associated domain-containing protein [Paenibacillus sp. PK3_47]UQZ36315.1 hypothetical protein C2I18_23985 [Paenibacillus sp. PK3_47]